MAEQITLREPAAPNVNYNALCIEYPEVVTGFKLKYSLIHLLSKFSGIVGEDPHKHLKEFQILCSTTMRLQEITEDHVNLIVFPFSV